MTAKHLQSGKNDIKQRFDDGLGALIAPDIMCVDGYGSLWWRDFALRGGLERNNSEEIKGFIEEYLESERKADKVIEERAQYFMK